MRRKTARLNIVVVVLAAAFGVTGCTTDAPPDSGVQYSGSQAQQLREHQRKQRLRSEQGGYKRLYRPRDCRQPARDCSGFPTYTPS